MNTHTHTLIAILSLLLSHFAQSAEWNGGEKWNLFDCPERRAMWVWNPVAVTGTKTENRSWDPTPNAPRNAQARFYENYKGSQDLFFDFCENKSIRVLYFYNAVWEWHMADLDNATPTIPHEADFANFVAEANNRGIQVWLMCYLWDDPDDSRMTITAQKQSIKRLAEAAHRFNIAHPTTPIAGIHLDQEPNDITVYDDLLDTLKIAQDWVDTNSPDIIISQALRPKWRNQNVAWNGITKPMSEHIMDTIGHGAYMSYNDNLTTVKSWLTPIINYTSANGKKISSGFEVNDLTGLWPNSDEETWWEEIRNEPLASRFKVDTAGPVTFEDAMHDIVDTYKKQAGYDRQVIHSYADYFHHWFGEHPRDYLLNLPSGEYVSANQNPAKVNLKQDSRNLLGLGPIIGTPKDNDANGLNDAWEIKHFGAIGTLTSDADNDGDGYTAFQEMVFGLDPESKDPANALVTIQIVDDAGTDKIEFKYRRPLNHATLEVNYQLETSTDLSTTGPGKWIADSTAGTLSDDGTTQWVTFLMPINPDKTFYRCKVTPAQ